MDFCKWCDSGKKKKKQKQKIAWIELQKNGIECQKFNVYMSFK